MAASIPNNFVIAQRISQFLRPSDLAHCVLVSKKWNNLFTSRLWRSIDFEKNIQIEALVRNRNHIRTIDSFSEYDTRAYNLLQLMAIPPFLRRISITFGFVDAALEEEWISSMDEHTGLEHLEFKYTSFRYPRYIPRLLYICPRLQSLHIRMESRQLKNTSDQEVILNAPFLDCLRLPALHHEESFHKVTQIIEQRGGTITETKGLQSLNVQIRPGMGPTVIPGYFPVSLTELQLNSPCLCVQAFARVIGRLSNLTSLEAKVRLNLSEETEVAGIFLEDWACLGLKKLNLRILSVSSHVQLARYVFGQIGRLQGLEELRLDGDQYHLKLDDGCLRYLEGLKRLREIVIHPLGYKLREREVQWIIDHWKSLTLFGVGSNNSLPYYRSYYMNGQYSKSFTRLISRRPWVQIEIGGEIIYSQQGGLVRYEARRPHYIRTLRR
ncbi:hypothetical protein BGZ49_000760 [Haplosporangium sp. Z 27]|nr:hypothetical protein BGZ49_000760 [Haplosporangium sp. Z 27]